MNHTDECAEQINAYDECLNPDCDCECHPYDEHGYISGESA